MEQAILDTNALAMLITDDQRVPKKAREFVLSASIVSISAITFYEIGQKVRLGKWPEMAPFANDLVEIVVADGFNLIPLNSRHALSASLLDWAHRDPFDRIIAAVTMIEGAILISSDDAFDQLSDLRRIWG